MATRAHSTRTPLLRLSGNKGLSRFAQPDRSPQSLLGLGLGRQPGPVTIALAAMYAADPDLDRQRIRELRRRIAERIEADIALLDALDGDPDFEDGADAEPSLCGLMAHWPSPGGDDREFDEAEGRDPSPDWSGRGVHEVFVGRRA